MQVTPVSKTLAEILLVTEELNSELGAKTPEAKLDVLRKSKLPLDSDLASATKWDYPSISKRGVALAKLGYQKVWNLK